MDSYGSLSPSIRVIVSAAQLLNQLHSMQSVSGTYNMKVSTSYRYARDIANLIAWYERCKRRGIMNTEEMNFDAIFTFGKHEGDSVDPQF